MKLLLDTSIWQVLYQLLQQRQLDVDWLGNWPQQPSDRELLSLALAQQRIIVTLGDHLEQCINREHLPHHGILQLPAFASGVEQAKQCLRLLTHCQHDLNAGSLVTLNENGIQVRSSFTPTKVQ